VVAFAAYVGTWDGPRFDGKLANASDAIEATKAELPERTTNWRATTVTLVQEARDISVAGHTFPAGGLTPDGFPGPVWVVVVTAKSACDGTSKIVRLPYIFEARSGRPVIVSATRCPCLVSP
jgi:hypothetical protein